MRTEILAALTNTFFGKTEWTFFDANEVILRDALKLSDFRKIEIYHHGLEAFQDLLIYQAMQPGLTFSILHRQVVFESVDMNLFVESYLPSSSEIQNEMKERFFAVKSALAANDSNVRILIIEFVALSLYGAIPATKHFDKIVSSLPDFELFQKGDYVAWADQTNEFLMNLAEIKPAELLASEEIQVRRHNDEHNAEVLSRVLAQRPRLEKFLSWPKNIQNLDDQIRFGEKARKQWEAGEAFHYQIFYEDQFAGAVSIHSLNMPDGSYEFGYWIDEKFEGRGFIQRTLHLLMAEMKDKGWVNAKITVKESNIRSQKIPLKLEMRLISEYVRNNERFLVYSA
ncbi:GNAT family N-acetyltransferase [Bdellovibrio sp. NC01]|uniref:GNAT family N-acetyltransferase n=1 Tax=Bdellovibrio sp. NC01 TaxID=2220073 RepID=UPI00143DD9E9|nr:GNAT family N-acetyltransferase [Bdellovibrio sp. NC01]